MNAPVLVTGGAGCIGIQVCRELDRRGIEVHLLDLGEQIARVRKALPEKAKVFYGSILDVSSIREAMAGCGAVIHLAALLGVRRTE
ncbi:MAG TPA: SDR family NAD(P)-dependent oxidoreductase, partial [Nitrospira sp.]|nr:SDR family NAD(P)-dependent oxidoreductase [Nitrospira sp.]